jgi:pseudouridine-5'-phosphate glycosidase
VTPFVLAFLHGRSGRRTLAVNRELVVANARLASEIAALEARDGDGPDDRQIGERPEP